MKRLTILNAVALAVAGLAMASELTADQTADAQAASPAAPAGQEIFQQRCQACHSREPGRTSPLGPNLYGVVGRAAASGDFQYSQALKDSGLAWDRETLDRFLAAPMQMVPGTRMVIALRDDAKRKAVIDYLADTLSDE